MIFSSSKNKSSYDDFKKFVPEGSWNFCHAFIPVLK